jgi:hypothetical protein
MLCLSLLFSCASAFGTVYISSPATNSSVGGSVAFNATANTSCAKGIASMGIYPAPYQLA